MDMSKVDFAGIASGALTNAMMGGGNPKRSFQQNITDPMVDQAVGQADAAIHAGVSHVGQALGQKVSKGGRALGQKLQSGARRALGAKYHSVAKDLSTFANKAEDALMPVAGEAAEFVRDAGKRRREQGVSKLKDFRLSEGAQDYAIGTGLQMAGGAAADAIEGRKKSRAAATIQRAAKRRRATRDRAATRIQSAARGRRAGRRRGAVVRDGDVYY